MPRILCVYREEWGRTGVTPVLQMMQQISGKRLTYDKLTTSHLKYIVPAT